MLETELAFQGQWKQVPIQDNQEVLVQVPEYFCFPFYADVLKVISDRRIFVRESVLTMFKKAHEIIKCFGMDLKIYDGWRSVDLQEKLYWLYMKQFTVASFPHLVSLFSAAIFATEIKTVFATLTKETQDTLHQLNRKYVSWPSKNKDFPSPHATGGAIDVWLFQDDKCVDLGVDFDSMEESAGAFYHLYSDRAKFHNDDMVCEHRNLLLHAMTDAGFSCYPPEIWHFNYGNQMHALVTGGAACYSYIEI